MQFIFRYFMVLITCFSVERSYAQNDILFSGLTLTEVDSQLKKHNINGGANAPMFSMLDVNNDSKQDLFVYDRHSEKVLVYLYVGKNEYVHSRQYEAIFPEMHHWVLFKDYNQDGKADMWTRNDYYNTVMLYRNVTKAGDPHCKFEKVSDGLRAYNFNEFIDTSNIFCDKNNIPAIEDVDNDGDIDFITLQSTGLGVTLFLNNCVENQLPLDPPSFEMPDDCWGDFSESANSNEIFLTRYPFCRRTYYRYKKHAGGSSMLLFDRDNDGDKDLLLGNAGYSDLVYLKNGKTDFGYRRDTIIDLDMAYPSIPAKADIYAASYLLKTEDGLLLLVAPAEIDDQSAYPNQSGKIQVYQDEDTSNSFEFQLDTQHLFNRLFIDQGAYSSPAMGDINGDGLTDLLIAGNGNIRSTRGLSDRIQCYLGKGNYEFTLYTHDLIGLSHDSLQSMAIHLKDFDGDQKVDLIIGDKTGRIQIWKNKSESGSIQFESTNWTSAVTIPDENPTPYGVDLDKDGLTDLLCGSRKGNIYYFKNTGSESAPAYQLISDSLGRMNFNPLVNKTVFDPMRQEWVDSLVHADEGFTSVAVMNDSMDGYKFLVSHYKGIIAYFKNSTPSNLLAAWEVDTTFKIIPTNDKELRVGNFAKVSVFQNSKETIMLAGSSRGGIEAFTRKNTTFINNPKQIKPVVLVYPNPAAEFVHLTSTGRVMHITLLNLQGVELIKTAEPAINLREVPSGCYLMQIKHENNIIVTHKLIISR